MKEFRIAFGKNHRPQFDELDLYWTHEIANLFHKFADYILEKYDLRLAVPIWTEKDGWSYRIGRTGVFLFPKMTIFSDGFQIDGIKVMDLPSYHTLILHVDQVYLKEKEDFENKIQIKNKEQKERNKKRIEREKREKELLQSYIIPEKYNKFHWPEKLDLTKLRKLYLLDAKGICNEELADDIGLTLFIRCQYGRSDNDLMKRNAIRCHHCGKIVYGTTDFRECSCGYQYSYREYRRSYCRNHMPAGAAAKIFYQYEIDWPKAKSYKSKMMLIDGLLHEFHLSLISGTVNRPVAMNFIDGSRQMIQRIITELSL